MSKIDDVDHPVLKKPNRLVVIIPKVGRLTLLSRKIFNILIHRTQHEMLFSTENYKFDIRNVPVFSMPLREITAKLLNGDKECNDPGMLQIVRKHLEDLVMTKVELTSPDKGSFVTWSVSGLITYGKTEGRGSLAKVSWSLAPEILESVIDPEIYTQINLDQLLKLSNYCGLALYDICARYQNNPSHLTSRNSPEWWIDALTMSKENSKRRVWRQLKDDSVKDAIIDINNKTDLIINLIEHKTGKAVTEIQFSVIKKNRGTNVQKVEFRTEAQQKTITNGADIGISESIVKSLSDTYESGVLNAAILKVNHTISQSEAGTIKNPASYLRAVLKNTPTIQIISPTSNTSSTISQSDEMSRFSVIKKEFLDLTTDARQVFANQVIEDLKSKKINVFSAEQTVKLISKLTSGSIVGPILTEVILKYEVEKYGTRNGICV